MDISLSIAKKLTPEVNNDRSSRDPGGSARSFEADRADRCDESLFDQLDIPIFGKEGDIFTFIYIIEG